MIYRLEFVGEVVFEVLLLGGIEGEFKTDEELVFAGLEGKYIHNNTSE